MSEGTIPIFVPLRDGRSARCTACTSTLTAVTLLGSDKVVLFCDGCGRRAVLCTCPPPEWHPWHKS